MGSDTSEVLAALMARPYRKVITRTPDGTFLGEVPELPGCMTEGDSENETLALLSDAMREWLTTAIELGRTIPAPSESDRAFSGKFNLRVPRSLHRQLKERAQENSVSLNEYCVLLLAQGVSVNPILPVARLCRALEETVQATEVLRGYMTWRQSTGTALVVASGGQTGYQSVELLGNAFVLRNTVAGFQRTTSSGFGSFSGRIGSE